MNWPKQTPNKIIVRMPNWLGDLVMATPVLQNLRGYYPEAMITAMCQDSVGDLLKYDPNIDDIFSFNRPNGWLHHTHPYSIIDTLRQREFDLGILLPNSLSSAWWFWLGNVKNRIGYKDLLRDVFLNRAVPFPKTKETQHLVITYQMLLEPLGILLSNTPPKLYLSEKEKNEAKALLCRFKIDLSRDVIVGINPGAAYGSAKCWPLDRFLQLTNVLLQNKKIKIVYFGDASGSSLVSEICRNQNENVVNLAGKTTLRELVALIASCSVFLTNDSGPMHIADALGIPLVALFGSTSDIKTGPYSNGKVIHKHVECSPCYKRVCPIDFRCMKRIEVQEVYEEIQKLIPKLGDNE